MENLITQNIDTENELISFFSFKTMIQYQSISKYHYQFIKNNRLFRKVYYIIKINGRSKKTICEIAKTGNLDVLKWYLTRNEPSLDHIDNIRFAVFEALEEGYLHIIEWLFNNSPNAFSSDIFVKCIRDIFCINGIDHLAFNGHISILDWIYERRTQFLFHYTFSAIDLACKYGKIETLDWFINHPELKFKYSTSGIDFACSRGNVKILEWFHNHPELEFKYTKDSIDWACNSGHIEILDWFNNHPDKEFKYTKNAIDDIYSDRQIKILDWFWKYRSKYPLIYSEKTLDHAAQRGHVKVLDWFKDRQLDIKYDSAIDLAAQRGKLNVLNWFYNNRYSYQFKYTIHAIDTASIENHIHVLDWFLERSHNISFIYRIAIDWSMMLGNIQVLDWFVEYSDIIPFRYVKGFLTSSHNKNPKIIEWFEKHHEFLEDKGRDTFQISKRY